MIDLVYVRLGNAELVEVLLQTRCLSDVVAVALACCCRRRCPAISTAMPLSCPCLVTECLCNLPMCHAALAEPRRGPVGMHVMHPRNRSGHGPYKPPAPSNAAHVATTNAATSPTVVPTSRPLRRPKAPRSSLGCRRPHPVHFRAAGGQRVELCSKMGRAIQWINNTRCRVLFGALLLLRRCCHAMARTLPIVGGQ